MCLFAPKNGSLGIKLTYFPIRVTIWTNKDKKGEPHIAIALLNNAYLIKEGVSMDDIKKYLTVRQVANKLSYTEEWVRDLIKAKR